jgi:hypothetical protein
MNRIFMVVLAIGLLGCNNESAPAPNTTQEPATTPSLEKKDKSKATQSPKKAASSASVAARPAVLMAQGSYHVSGSKKIKGTLGSKPGLGSPDFKLSNVVYEFPKDMKLEFRRSAAKMQSGRMYGKDTPWKPITGPARYAYDVRFMDNCMPVTAIQVNGSWFTPYGASGMGEDSTKTHLVASICMSEQACADFRIPKTKGGVEKLRQLVTGVYMNTGEVNKTELHKRPKCVKKIQEAQKNSK